MSLQQSTPHEGCIVRVQKGDDAHEGKMFATRDSGGKKTLYLRHSGSLEHLKEDGWTVTVLKNAPVELPTKPGWYKSRYFDTTMFSLDGGGKWIIHFRHSPRGFCKTAEEIAGYAPLVPLVPES